MPYRQAVEGFFAVLPRGKVFFQQSAESRVVGRLYQVDQLVNDEILQAGLGLSGQFTVEADGPPFRRATPPLGPHSLNMEACALYPDTVLPFFQERDYCLLEAFTIPFLYDFPAPLLR